MKIAIPNWSAVDSLTDNVAFTFRKHGHQVIQPERHDAPFGTGPIPTVARRLAEAVGVHPMTWQERWILGAVREHKFDLVLALTQALSADTLEACKKAGVGACVAWWCDSPANMRRMGLLERGWDLICLKDPDAVRKLQVVGLPTVLVHEAMNPEWHKVVAGQANQAVAIVGNWYGYRQWIAMRLREAGYEVQMFGPKIPRWGLRPLLPSHSGRSVFRLEKSQVFGEALASLNSTSLAEGNSLNCRAFEVAGAGGLQLMEDRQVVSECFEPGKEVLVYGNWEQLCDHLDWARRAPSEMARIRDTAARRALANHTYSVRLDGILRTLGWPGL